MEYDFERIGKRICYNRKKLGLTQEGFILKLNTEYYIPIKRQTYINIEHGRIGKCRSFDLAFMNALCKVFRCDMGYLLCDQGYEDNDCKTRAAIDVKSYTGLSDAAIDAFFKLKDSEDGDTAMSILDSCMSAENGEMLQMLVVQIYYFLANGSIKDPLARVTEDTRTLGHIQGLLTLFRNGYEKEHLLDNSDNLSNKLTEDSLDNFSNRSNKLRVYHTVDRDTSASHYDGLPDGTKQFIRDIAKEYDLHLPDDDFSQASRDIVAKFCKEHPDVVSNYIASRTKQRA